MLGDGTLTLFRLGDREQIVHIAYFPGDGQIEAILASLDGQIIRSLTTVARTIKDCDRLVKRLQHSVHRRA